MCGQFASQLGCCEPPKSMLLYINLCIIYLIELCTYSDTNIMFNNEGSYFHNDLDGNKSIKVNSFLYRTLASRCIMCV